MFRVVIANPGTHPEPAQLAAGLKEAGSAVSYWTSASWSVESSMIKVARSRVGRNLPFAGMVRRRALPNALQRGDVVRLAGMREFWFQLLRRRQSARASAALASRSAAFRLAAARRASRLTDVDCIVAQQTAALELFESAPPNIVRVLTYPIAHHRWMSEYLGQEAEENPDWAPFLQGHDRPESELRRLDREIELATAVVVPSGFVRDTFIEQGVSKEKVHVQNLGASTIDLFGEGSELEWTCDGLRVLFVGQITQRKGISYLLDGFHQANLEGAQLTLMGPLVGGIEKKIPQDGSVRVLPPRSRAALGNVYRSADVFVFPSLAEGFPLSAIEAMACGLPLIISDKTFASDVISPGVDGFIVPARDATAICRHLKELAEDPPRRQAMGRKAGSRAADFTWEQYRQTAPGLLRTILAAHSRPAEIQS